MCETVPLTLTDHLTIPVGVEGPTYVKELIEAAVQAYLVELVADIDRERKSTTNRTTAEEFWAAHDASVAAFEVRQRAERAVRDAVRAELQVLRAGGILGEEQLTAEEKAQRRPGPSGASPALPPTDIPSSTLPLGHT